MTSCAMTSGFTFVEVLAMVLVVALGLITILGIFAVAQHHSAVAQAQATAMATAVTVANDAHPWADPTFSEWVVTDPDLDQPSYAVSASGFVNGWYVERQETSGPADIVATDALTTPPHVTLRSAQVQVQVYESKAKAKTVSGYVTRILRQRGTP